ncbi:septum site-determining protein MinC [Marinospirillum sp.]|uniref:septum site-determining protein MinC n=1 Tax=Marinospirillum sp. TaxID=2183934 RepID=UPI003850AF81
MADATSPRLNLVTTPFKLKGTSLPATLMQPNTGQIGLLEAELESRLAKGSALLKVAPLVLDLSQLDQMLDLSELQEVCKRLGIQFLAVRTADKNLQAYARKLGLMALNSLDRPATAANQEEMPRTLVHQGTVRSGQQLINEKGDLVVMGSVNPGAEVLASGQIHVYGAIRGRALAGIQGDQQARIFTLRLEAELIAIAGHYQTSYSADFVTAGDAVCIELQGEKLVSTALTQL